MARSRPGGRKAYKAALRDAQVALVKLQKHVIETERKVLIVLEGRDAAGKDGTIKRIVEHLSPRETRVFAPGKPSDRDRKSWYFQRYVAQLPVAGEIVLFNRSWYNRAGVEPHGMAPDSSFLFAGVYRLVTGALPAGPVQLGAVAFAGWLGLVVTALNLAPVGQLDGGHIAYALFGPRGSATLSRVIVGLLVVGGVFFSRHLLMWAWSSGCSRGSVIRPRRMRLPH